MVDVQQAVEHVWQFLAEELSLDDFEDWSAIYLAEAFQSADTQAQDAGRVIRAILNAYGDDASEENLRAELATAISPFVKSSAENSVGKPSMIAESGASSDINSLVAA
jgi:hypothetical protein